MASLFQFSIRQLLIAIAFLAVGLVALRNASEIWVSAFWGAVPLLLAVAILLVIFRRGRAQAFWIGFALVGGMYAAIVLIAYWPAGDSARYDPLAYHQLWTTRLIDWAYPKIIPEPQRLPQIPNPALPGAGGPGGMPGSAAKGGMSGVGGMPKLGGFPGGPFMGSGFGGGGGPGSFIPPTIVNPDYVDAITFQQIGHALWLVILAALGGKLAQWIYRTEVRDQGTGVS